jgi:hypothetical protein
MHILWTYKIIFYSHPAKSYRTDKNSPKCREIPSQSHLVHNISVPPKCTVPKSGWIPWNDRFISVNKVQINYRAVVTKYIELVLRGSIETKSIRPRQTADNKIAYKIYLLKKVQCLGHENKLRNLTQIYIYIYIYVLIIQYSDIYEYNILFHNLQLFYMCTLFNFTVFSEIIVGVLTTYSTQYIWDRSICVYYLIVQHRKFMLHTYRCSICAHFVILQTSTR